MFEIMCGIYLVMCEEVVHFNGAFENYFWKKNRLLWLFECISPFLFFVLVYENLCAFLFPANGIIFHFSSLKATQKFQKLIWLTGDKSFAWSQWIRESLPLIGKTPSSALISSLGKNYIKSALLNYVYEIFNQQ